MNKENYNKLMEEEFSKPDTKDKLLLLHACCAPCSSHVLMLLKEQIRLRVYYYNPNIVDREEYEHRSSELKRLIEAVKGEYGIQDDRLSYILAPYDPSPFLEVSKGLEREPEGGRRCEGCFELRLRAAALMAKAENADYFTTTLTISPLKNAELINGIGRRIAVEEGITWLPSDFKKKGGYADSVELSKKYGLYRQDYCGCPYSKAERALSLLN